MATHGSSRPSPAAQRAISSRPIKGRSCPQSRRRLEGARRLAACASHPTIAESRRVWQDTAATAGTRIDARPGIHPRAELVARVKPLQDDSAVIRRDATADRPARRGFAAGLPPAVDSIVVRRTVPRNRGSTRGFSSLAAQTAASPLHVNAPWAPRHIHSDSRRSLKSCAGRIESTSDRMAGTAATAFVEREPIPRRPGLGAHEGGVRQVQGTAHIPAVARTGAAWVSWPSHARGIARP